MPGTYYYAGHGYARFHYRLCPKVGVAGVACARPASPRGTLQPCGLLLPGVPFAHFDEGDCGGYAKHRNCRDPNHNKVFPFDEPGVLLSVPALYRINNRMPRRTYGMVVKVNPARSRGSTTSGDTVGCPTIFACTAVASGKQFGIELNTRYSGILVVLLTHLYLVSLVHVQGT